MRNPFRTEAEAFSFVIVIGILCGAVALAGVVGGRWVGLGVFLALGLGVAVGIYMKSEPRTAEPAVWDRRRARPGEPKKVLVIANETVAGRALRGEIVHRTEGAAADVLVVCPALNSRIRHWTSDEDEARERAQERLDESLAALAAEGVDARGEVGDDDPMQAIDDALRTFGADEIIISTHPPGRSNWLESGLITRTRERFDLPITHVVVDLEHERTTSRRN
ncbi:MAG TPA: universal stress protein [Gaiellaceae bacterium]|jgi:GABA permease|nr:universal stress protein [Gaiellaceae bacterium]